MSEPFAELKEEINKLQRACQAAAEKDPRIPAGTALVDVPGVQRKMLDMQQETMIEFLNEIEVSPRWLPRLLEAFHLVEHGLKIEARRP